MSKKNFKHFFKIVIEGLHTSPMLFLLEFLQSAISIMLNIISLISTKLLLGSLQQSNITNFCFVVILISSVNFLLSGISAFIDPLIARKTEYFNNRVISVFLEKARKIQLSKFDEQDFYSKYTLAFDKCCSIFHTYITCFIQTISAIVNIIITVIVLSWVPLLYVSLLLIFAFMQTIIGNSIRKDNYEFQAKTVSKRKNLNYIYRLFYIPEFMRDIRVNNISDFIFKKRTRNHSYY